MSLASLLDLWRGDVEISGNFTAWETAPPRPPDTHPLPQDLDPNLARALGQFGILDLYAHQAEAWEAARRGEHVALVTGTASGKSLAYNLPVLDRLAWDPGSYALFLFPTKALAQDQQSALGELLRAGNLSSAIPVATYDGDTPSGRRQTVRQNARVLITNPDMLHLGILPHHTRWSHLFRHLAFVVVDEMHIYRGVFGSHLVNVLRRLKRLAGFYGSDPQFILTSATIGNPQELAEGLVEDGVRLIERDGAARGARHFLIYNPPVINPELGLRQSPGREGIRLSRDLLAYQIQTIVFAGTRRGVELTLTELREQLPDQQPVVRGYRSGYLPAERREIERGLRNGQVRAVVATNALELGIDIGGMGAALLVGYPGSISGTWQQAGRAGRGLEDSLAILIASSGPLDQFLAHHPDYFFGRSPEQALINPDNLLILLDHIRCAAFELPFRQGEGFGRLPPDRLQEFLEFLLAAGDLHHSQEKYFWTAEGYPAQQVSLRSASSARVLLQREERGGLITIGEVDGESATWMVHPGAIYLHEGRSYRVEDLDLEGQSALLEPCEVDYFTQARNDTSVELLALAAASPAQGALKAHGEIMVTSQVTGYFKIHWETRERLDVLDLEMPPTQLQTTGYWLALHEETVEALRAEGVWRDDPNEYGPTWRSQRDLARARDGYRCQNCGRPESGLSHHVHHKTPFRTFASPVEANRLENLITLCPTCHRRAETVVRVRSGLGGLAYTLNHLAPLHLMCDPRDLGVHADPQSPLGDGQPVVVLFDRVPAGIGFSRRLYELHSNLMHQAHELVAACACLDGCPSCVGPGGEAGLGGKAETLALLAALSQPGGHS